MKQPEQKLPGKAIQNFPVVGIGASAGGLDAFRKIIAGIPADSGMAYVVVQHLSPDYDSKLTEILSQQTNLPVHEIVSEINLVPNHIYIVPENNRLTAVDGMLHLEKRSRNEIRNQTIDVFFGSLAAVHKTFAIGVLLSGTAFDGTEGLKKISEAGGVTIVQDPETATFKGMPLSAIEANTVDHICAPEDIPQKLIEVFQSYNTNYGYSEQEHIPTSEEETLRQILSLVLLRTGNDFQNYKQPTIRRRIARRMVMHRKETLLDYYHKVRIDKDEQEALLNDLLIPVTYFFRDEQFFKSLPVIVFPELLQNVVNNHLRIWVAGCSTGEEAYSLAIALHEYLLANNRLDVRVQIFASDISERNITKARLAMYAAQDVKQISEERLLQYFTKREGHYHINKVIRDMCVFAVHNFIKDPPFARIDMISCRNVLIYFNTYLQEKVLGSFHYSLRNKAFLLLGKSETASNMPHLFDTVGKSEKIYTRKIAPGNYVAEVFNPVNIPSREKVITNEKKGQEDDFRKIASDILFQNYTPVGVVVNENLDIVHFHGDTSAFLLQSPGKPNFNLLKMAREGISFELRNALAKFKETPELIIKQDVVVRNQPYRASFEIVPLQGDGNHLMVLFYKKSLPDADPDGKRKRKSAEQQRIIELENELSQMREDIKRVTEEQQTAYEELQTTNEELLSSTEELQALNEELETSTEELQSNNEELMCVNDELMDRQEQLSSLRNYSEFIAKTIREPLIIIDNGFMIKNANPAFYTYFGTTESETEGQSFFDIGNGQWNIAGFKEKLTEVFSNKTFVDDLQVETISPAFGKKMLMANIRYIANSKNANLLLIAFTDITEVVNMNQQLLSKNEILRLHNEQLQLFSSSASHDLQEPLRKIHMFCKKIVDDDKALSSESRHRLERIMISINSMSELINDLIRFTKVNIMESDYRKTDMNLLLKKTVHDLKDSIAERKAKITIEPLPYLNVLPFQMQQLFINLLINSIKYTKSDTIPVVKINTTQPSHEEIDLLGGNHDINYTKICVSDNGIGFKAEYAERIFSPFYRLHTKDEYRGSGLGLTLSKKIVQNHNGFITAKSKVGEGTVINIYLPLI